MGYQTLVKSLNPIAHYTFDKTTSFVDAQNGTGVYLNTVETGIPSLQLRYMSLIGDIYNLKIVTPTLVEAEVGSDYNGFSSSTPNTITYTYLSDKNVLSYYTVGATSANLYTEVDNINDELYANGDDNLSLTFQMIYYKTDLNRDTAVLYMTKDIDSPSSYFGIFSACSLQPYDVDGNMIVDKKNPINDSSTLMNNTLGTIIPAVQIENKMIWRSKVMMRVGGLELSTTKYEYNSSYGRLYINGNDTSILLESSKQYHFNILYNRKTNIAKLYIDMQLKYTGKVTEKTTNRIELGYRSELSFYKSINSKITAYYVDVPESSIWIDNFSIFNQELSIDTINLLYVYTKSMKNRYIDCGFTELITFEDLVDKDNYYISSDTRANNSIGSVRPNIINKVSNPLYYQDKESNFPYVDTDLSESLSFKTFLRLTKSSSLVSKNYYEYWGSSEVSLIKGDTYTLSFYFRTSDSEGNLFNYPSYDWSKGTYSLRFIGSILYIFYSGKQVSNITGMANNKWHHVYITSNSKVFNIYIDFQLYFQGDTVSFGVCNNHFGNILPGNSGLVADFAMIASSTSNIPISKFKLYSSTYLPYKAVGKVTINNIGIDAKLYIYNNETGALIDTVYSTNLDNGVFMYTNTFPYTISIVVISKYYNNGLTYVVSPISIN